MISERPRGTRSVINFPLAVTILWIALLAPATAATIGATVTIDDGLSFVSVTVAPGEAVEFVNNDTERHRMRSTSGPSQFDTGDIDPGESTTVILSAVGTYLYEDHRNDHDARYQGTILVSATPSPPSPDPSPTPTPDPAPTSSAVQILDRSFSPASISVTAGTTVEWANVSGRDHTTTANDGSFDSGNLAEGAAWSRTFDTPGTFAYFCVIHPDMTGVVAVSAVGTPPPPPPPPPTATTAPPPPPPSTIPTIPAPGPATGTINVVDFSFDPASTSIRVGDTLVWQNFGVAPHTVTADDRSFDSGFLNTGQTYERTFTQEGTYSYFCTIHPDMRAVVAVGAADEPPPSAPLPPAAPPPPASPAGSSPSTGASNPPPPGQDTVQMLDFAFRATTTNARVGDTIVWANVGAAPHTATARDGSFDTGFVMPGDNASIRLAAVGSFSFYCTIHPEMTGTLVVTDAPAGLDVSDLADDDAEDPLGIGGESDATGPGDGALEVQAAGADESPPVITTVDVIDFNYAPRHLEIEQGTTITFEWVGDAPHTVTDRDGGFDSGILQKGAAWSQTFAELGRVSYHCTLHPDMAGVIDVVAPPPDEAAVAALVTGGFGSGSGGTSPATKGLIGGGIFLGGGALFLYAALLFMRWASAEETRLSNSALN